MVSHQHLRQLRLEAQNLPIGKVRDNLVRCVKDHDTVIFVGETGSGKTTQIPQFLLDAKVNEKGSICVTQPRRVAAISVAQRVAAEMGCEVGTRVGYAVRFEECTSDQTLIRYATDGILLREVIADPLLSRYSVIIIDEVHERSVNTDILLCCVKLAQQVRNSTKSDSANGDEHSAAKRLKSEANGEALQSKVSKEAPNRHKRLKVIVMSAAMNVDLLSKYFNKAPVFYIDGRAHPIEIQYTEESHDDYVLACCSLAYQLHGQLPIDQDILIFLTGSDEIEAAVRLLRGAFKKQSQSENSTVRVLPFYSALSAVSQQRVFAVREGERRIVVATNIAETSITIPRIRYVIDCGFTKQRFVTAAGVEVLRVVRESREQATQRAGRAGRIAPGTCVRLFTEREFDELAPHTIAEIRRTNLATVVLQLAALGVKRPTAFDFIESPPRSAFETAVSDLLHLGAVCLRKPKTEAKAESTAKGIKLTSLGKSMVRLPLDPRLARAVLRANELGARCLLDVLVVVALLNVDAVFLQPASAKQREAAARCLRERFASPDGDALTLLRVYSEYKRARGNARWCRDHFVNTANLRTATRIYKQLRDITRRLFGDIEKPQAEVDSTALRKALLSGLVRNVAVLSDPLKATYVPLSMPDDSVDLLQHKPAASGSNARVTMRVHPSSVLFGCTPPFVTYVNVVHTTCTYMQSVSAIDVDWLAEIDPKLKARASALYRAEAAASTAVKRAPKGLNN